LGKIWEKKEGPGEMEKCEWYPFPNIFWVFKLVGWSGQEWCMHGGEYKGAGVWLENLKERGYLEEISTDGRII
jgi:hypothetical protein